MPETQTTRLYRIENPTIAATPDGVVSHEDLVGQWFTPDVDTAATYLRKSTQTFGRNAHVIDGAQLVVVDVPSSELSSLHVAEHLVASSMDVENDNFIVPFDAGYPRLVVSLDKELSELRGNLARPDQMTEAKARLRKIVNELGEVSLAS